MTTTTRSLVLAAALAASTLAPAAAGADTRLHALGDQASRQVISVTSCRMSAICIVRGLTQLQRTHSAIAMRGTAILDNAPSDACYQAMKPLVPALQRAIHTTTAWGYDTQSLAKLTAWGRAELPLVRMVWRVADAC